MIMNEEFWKADRLVKFEFLEKYLNELGLKTKFIKKSDTVIFDTLSVLVGQDSNNVPRTVNFNIIPVPKDKFPRVDFIQVAELLTCSVTSRNRVNIEKLLSAVNLRSTIGNYIIDPDQQVLFKYVFPIASTKIIDKNEFIEIISMYLFMAQLFNDHIIKLAQGKSNLNEILPQLDK